METSRKAALAKGDKQYFTGVACVKGHVAARRARTGECLECRTLFLVQWRQANPQKVKQHNLTQYSTHSDQLKARSRKYYEENIEIVRVRSKEYQRKNLHKFAAVNAKRDAAKIQRTPKWLTEDDIWMMKEIYELAKLREEVVGGAWHVDHIVPLQGKNVSGLHVPTNLQVIPAKANRSKSNMWSPS